MKKIFLIIGVLVFTASVSYAGSSVKGKVENNTKMKDVVNISMGTDNITVMGSVKIKDSKVGKGGEITNVFEIKNGINTSVGTGNETYTGSIGIE